MGTENEIVAKFNNLSTAVIPSPYYQLSICWKLWAYSHKDKSI